MSQMKTIDLFVKELIHIADGHIKFGDEPTTLVELIDFLASLKASENDNGAYAKILKDIDKTINSK